MLEVRAGRSARGGGVVGHRLAAPVVLPLELGARRPIPLRDPLAARVPPRRRRPVVGDPTKTYSVVALPTTVFTL
jgi:hypothetical protein